MFVFKRKTRALLSWRENLKVCGVCLPMENTQRKEEGWGVILIFRTDSFDPL